MRHRPWIFLTDADPAPPSSLDLSAPARALIAASGAPAPRDWFTAANNLGLALTKSGAAGPAACLMERCISLANQLAAAHPDGIEYGVESYANRIALLSQEDSGEAEAAYRACYDLVRGRPVRKRYLFGLDIGLIGSASAEIAQRSLAILRNRSQAGLLNLYVEAGGPRGAVSFARQVAADFPRSVAAGMLHAAEVIATADPTASFLTQFDPQTPQTEGDFVVLLRLLERPTERGDRELMADTGSFGVAIRRFQRRNTLRNPRTPLLWSVFHSVMADPGEDEIRAQVQRALETCRREDDERLYRGIASVASDYFTAPPFATASMVQTPSDPRSCLDEFAELAATLTAAGGRP